ncbi:MAG: hypothetical protein F2813_02245 [Actinobacteria bacterium]|uniref:Unannotated protein n=1 Tax=freshwater metagenome TaxID=449393 RepID=A0A6J5ZF30_9ZZZZ|nr:hypothetical protein [Actinomycetota bacterium]
MSGTSAPRYGTPNWEMIGRWIETPPEDDGPFWAVNLMKYREVADYADGRETTLTGREADDLYAPLGPLAEIGAIPAFQADVTDQLAGDPAWDRIAIVRYPSRDKFFEMQRREDFLELHAHKDAGMEFTIVFASTPVSVSENPGGGSHVLRLRRFAAGAAPAPDPDGVTPVAHFEIEGVIVGDDRTWDDARFDIVDDAALARLAETDGVEEQVIVVMGPAEFDELAASVAAAQ